MKSIAVFAFTITVLLTAGFVRHLDIPEAKKGSFRATQLGHSRVKAAYGLKYDGIKARLTELKIDAEAFDVFIRAFKKEDDLEIWVKNRKDSTWQPYVTYPICAKSGTPGPKRCQGDNQVPEGFYHVNIFNPYSNFLLSLGVSYPNASDRVFACKRDPGGAIMIHGSCVTIGCIPITDDMIQELYVLCVEAKNSGQKEIPIHIFPARLTDENILALKTQEQDVAVRVFWDNLKAGYDKFESSKKLPVVGVDPKGKYTFR